MDMLRFLSPAGDQRAKKTDVAEHPQGNSATSVYLLTSLLENPNCSLASLPKNNHIQQSGGVCNLFSANVLYPTPRQYLNKWPIANFVKWVSNS
jgi:hypothetical protein